MDEVVIKKYRGIKYIASKSNLHFNSEEERYEYWHKKWEERKSKMSETDKLINHIYNLME